MLVTILKCEQATQATILMLETFSKIRELSRRKNELLMIQDKAEQITHAKEQSYSSKFSMKICKPATREP